MKSEITAFILAGGKSTRMGTDKGLLLYKKLTFVENICFALKPLFKENINIISTNEAYGSFGYSRIEDIIYNKGPVGGIYTALSYTRTKFNLILSVDTPLISTELLSWLIKNYDYSSLVTQIQANNKINPLVAIYDKYSSPIFEQSIINNQLKLTQLIDRLKHKTLNVPKKWEHKLQNINTQNDYKNLIL